MKTLVRCVLPLWLVLLPLLAPCQSQPSAFRAVRHGMAVLPDTAATLFVLDGQLYCHTAGVLLLLQRDGSEVSSVAPDTDYVKLDEGIDYIVRHPVSGDLYFTATDRKGRSALYQYSPLASKHPKPKRVDMGDLIVKHPVFSADGNLMVFASTGRSASTHDYDLWYCRLEKEGWGIPRNMGGRVNTRMDETDPVICDGQLFFTSDGHSPVDGRSHLYATPLLPSQIASDTVGMLTIGRGRVSRLPDPFNLADASTSCLVFDTVAATAYWLSRQAGDTRPLRSFHGPLDARCFWGYVRDPEGNPLVGAEVTASHGAAVDSRVFTDIQGFYSLYLQRGQAYTLACRDAGRFSDSLRVPSVASVDENLVVEEQHDIVLGALPLNTPVQYLNLFGPGVSLSLGDGGIVMLQPLVRFLTDNPTFSVRLSLSNDITADPEFNALLTEQRLETLRSYLAAHLPSTVRVTLSNACGGEQKCDSASGLSRLAVTVEP